ncbi:MAG: HPr family phosphocarrier protein [Clostridiales bacterium]|nr:HPr family phosphocarrier protein [Clostridiales bacterium]
MVQFRYTVRSELGVHARPAGQLARLVRAFPSAVVTVSKGGVSARAGQVVRLMSLGIRKGDEVVVTVEGGDEADAAGAVETFFRENL